MLPRVYVLSKDACKVNRRCNRKCLAHSSYVCVTVCVHVCVCVCVCYSVCACGLRMCVKHDRGTWSKSSKSSTSSIACHHHASAITIIQPSVLIDLSDGCVETDTNSVVLLVPVEPTATRTLHSVASPVLRQSAGVDNVSCANGCITRGTQVG